MTFEDAIASLGDELGLPLEVEDGKAGFEASFGEDGEAPIPVEISADGDGEFVVFSAELGTLPSDDIEAVATRMLEANHLFACTEGAALAVEDDRALLERRIRFVELSRGDGANAVYSFIGTARSLRHTLREEPFF